MGIRFKISVCLVANLEILSILKKINWPREKFRNFPTSGAGVRVTGRRRQRWHWARWLSHRTLFVFDFAIFAQAIKNETRNWSSGELKMKLLARLNTRTAPPTSLSEFFSAQLCNASRKPTNANFPARPWFSKLSLSISSRFECERKLQQRRVWCMLVH